MKRGLAAQSGFGGLPIVVSDALRPPAPQNFAPYPFYDDYSDYSMANFYGKFNPYQQYPQYQPNFVVVTPRPKTKKKVQPKPSVRRPVPKDTMKLIDARSRPEKLRQPPVMDIKVIQATQQPNSKFSIEKFFFVPGKKLDELSTAESVPVHALSLIRAPPKYLQKALNSQKLVLQKQIQEEVENDDELETATTKVESVGMSSADQPIPGYYDAYFPQTSFHQAGSGVQATLILEPNSKAISGNDGTSISTPLSRAILYRGTNVKVLFKPQSVAITGANGIAHASADLLLDFIDEPEEQDGK